MAHFSNVSRMLVTLSVAVLGLSACQNDSSINTATDTTADSTQTKTAMTADEPKVTQVSVPTVKQPAVDTTKQVSPHATQLAEAVEQSHARLASDSSDVCPKLIDFKVGDTINFRQDETMRSHSCQYFIYPHKGEQLAVSISNNNMKAEMIAPKYFNFANGTYKVSQGGKHILSISYKSHHGNRPAQTYDLMVSSR